MARNIFNTVMMSKPKSSTFDLSHDVKMTLDMGKLVPTTVLECLPGDKFNIMPETMLRFLPLVAPVMHRVKVTTHYFFVPTRILWAEWEKWITGDSDVEAPVCTLQEESVVPKSGLADYLGVPVGEVPAGATLQVSPLPMAAYYKIFDEYYRDQNLSGELFQPVVPGENAFYESQLMVGECQRRAWQHDYFTSALPFAQKGDAVQIPLVSQEDIPVTVIDNTRNVIVKDTPGTGNAEGALSANAGTGVLNSATTGASHLDPNGTLGVDVQAGATDINTLRRAFRLQEWLERNARGGTRYVENILAHFGVKSSDARLQRPEYIGGSKQNMVISEVLATAQETAENIPVGNMAGHGISVGGGNRFSYRCEEHGFIIGIINVQPDTAYQQGLHRMFSRFDRLDYAWPTFANIGEQEVLKKELYAMASNTVQDEVFGYVPRYAEYKYLPSRVAGEMRDTLAFWHLGRIFTAPPSLNNDFVVCEPSKRIFAVTDEEEDSIVAHVFQNISVNRRLPKYGIPTI